MKEPGNVMEALEVLGEFGAAESGRVTRLGYYNLEVSLQILLAEAAVSDPDGSGIVCEALMVVAQFAEPSMERVPRNALRLALRLVREHFSELCEAAGQVEGEMEGAETVEVS